MEISIHIIQDRSIWDKFITTHGFWSLFQSYDWGVVQEQIGFKITRLGVYENKRLIGCAQIAFVTARRGKYLHIRQGPVFENNIVKEAWWKPLVTYLFQIGIKEKAWFVRVSPMINETPEHLRLLQSMRFHKAPIHAVDAEYCWILDINKQEKELLSGMRKSTRYLIRQAEKLGVAVTASNNIDEFLTLYKLTSRRQHFVPHQGIAEEWRQFSKNDNAFLLLARYEDKLMAGGIFLKFGKQVIYHHGASIPGKIPASCILQWHAIRKAKSIKAAIYNFWGIAPSNKKHHPWQGITLFKQGFGGQEMKFIHAHDLALSPLYGVSYTIETLRKLRRGY